MNGNFIWKIHDTRDYAEQAITDSVSRRVVHADHLPARNNYFRLRLLLVITSTTTARDLQFQIVVADALVI